MEGRTTPQETFLTSDDCYSLRKAHGKYGINFMTLQRYCSKMKTDSDDPESTVPDVVYIRKNLCRSSQLKRRRNFKQYTDSTSKLYYGLSTNKVIQ
ncbi:hypothetical protein AVEN_257992-1 [Araneus ventricosus]|uniref:Uncharacterized protein n=1 Tax=Araneus ventricosus TaxID=182803 RepID=A0A4Y2G421_ARAVE|nr:hypothetical protein AVEN_257992-1 [Araneus ventricosus]